MRFNPDPDYFGDAAVEIETDDRGYSGSGGPRTDTDKMSIAVSAVNDPPLAVIGPRSAPMKAKALPFPAVPLILIPTP